MVIIIIININNIIINIINIISCNYLFSLYIKNKNQLFFYMGESSMSVKFF